MKEYIFIIPSRCAHPQPCWDSVLQLHKWINYGCHLKWNRLSIIYFMASKPFVLLMLVIIFLPKFVNLETNHKGLKNKLINKPKVQSFYSCKMTYFSQWKVIKVPFFMLNLWQSDHQSSFYSIKNTSNLQKISWKQTYREEIWLCYSANAQRNAIPHPQEAVQRSEKSFRNSISISSPE